MSLFKDDAGKTEKPTPQKLGDARNKGQAPISKEFTMAGTLLVAVMTLESMGQWLIGAFRSILEQGMSLPQDAFHDGETQPMIEHLQSLIVEVGPPFAFLLMVFLASTILFGYGQIGIRVAKKALGIKLERLNPATNFQKLLSFSSVMKTILSFFKLCILGSVLYFVLSSNWSTLAIMHEIDDLDVSIGLIVQMAFTVFFWVAFVVLLMSLVDIAWQRYEYTKNLMMTKQEVDDERKRADGDPLIKSRMKQARMELMKQRMMEAVPQADVVITNPTHYAIAVKYDRGMNAAPQVVAKGADDLALKIREIADEHGIPRMEDPPLARALFRAVKVGQEIPERFYKAVAAVLSHVYRLKGQLVR